MTCKEHKSVLLACIVHGHGQFGPTVLLWLVDAMVEAGWWRGASVLVECSFGPNRQLGMATG